MRREELDLTGLRAGACPEGVPRARQEAQTRHPRVREEHWAGRGSESHLLGTCGQTLPFSPRARNVGRRGLPSGAGAGGSGWSMAQLGNVSPWAPAGGKTPRSPRVKGRRQPQSRCSRRATPEGPPLAPKTTPVSTQSPRGPDLPRVTARSSLHTGLAGGPLPARHKGREKGAQGRRLPLLFLQLRLRVNNSLPRIADQVDRPLSLQWLSSGV